MLRNMTLALLTCSYLSVTSVAQDKGRPVPPILTKDSEGKQKELILRGHNTWKKEQDGWLLLATYNTKIKAEEEDD